MAEMVSKNFSKIELSCPCCSTYGMMPIFVQKLQDLRDHYGRPMIINSAFRCKAHNASIGGELDSQHCLGLAVDILCVDSSERYELISLALMHDFRGIGIADNYVHLDYRSSIPRIWKYPLPKTA